MYDYALHQTLNEGLKKSLDVAGADNLFYTRFIANAAAIQALYSELYGSHPGGAQAWDQLFQTLIAAHKKRSPLLKARDEKKAAEAGWFLSNELAGMSLYVDRFCGNLKGLPAKLPHLEKLGVNVLHLMPLFQSPPGESDGGYAVSDFRKVDRRFGTLKDLQAVQQTLQQKGMYLMLDIVLNHTSHRHAWAQKAAAGDAAYQDYFYFFNDRTLPDAFEQTMPDIFPQSAPGSFTFVPECNQWVMTVFHSYQWDLNYTNPAVFVAMLDTIFFYANLGVDILRLDAPAFVWKQLGTTCQNLPQAHTLLRLLKQCVQVAAPGMALLGEAIVAPAEIMNYFGKGAYKAQECDFAYNATHMALQWDALATGDTRVMRAAQHELLKKPAGTSWITYTRCHDDIGLGYDDYMIAQAGFDPQLHRTFLKNYYAGTFPGTPSRGALFSFNPKTGDARISGTLASLCGLEKAVLENNTGAIDQAIQKIVLMQAHSFFIGGLPMLFYGDEVGYTNDYTYIKDPDKNYDNRWMHRPIIDWNKIKKIEQPGSVEARIFFATQRLLAIRKKLTTLADHSNIAWLPTPDKHVVVFKRFLPGQRMYGVFNFSAEKLALGWNIFSDHEAAGTRFFDHIQQKEWLVEAGTAFFLVAPYAFHLFEVLA